MFGFLRNIFGGSQNPVPMRHVARSYPVEEDNRNGQPPFDPSVLMPDGRSVAEYVERKLEEIRSDAFRRGVQVYDDFDYELTDFPMGADRRLRNAVAFEMIRKSGQFGLFVFPIDLTHSERVKVLVTKDPEE